MNKKHIIRFKELEEQLKQVGDTKYTKHIPSYGSRELVDESAFQEWRVKAKNLLVKCCGKDSEHYNEFIEGEKTQRMGETNLNKYLRLKAIFNAAKEDFEGGYLSSVRSLVQAEVFESELGQAEELLKNGYLVAAAVIAGIVLETGMRELCDREDISRGKLDTMNIELAREGVYNLLQQKRITALADIRNSAAHGKPDAFTKEDVTQMIRDVELFLLAPFITINRHDCLHLSP